MNDAAPTALITGGTVGIGREIARQMLNKGYKILIGARRAEILESARTELAAETGTSVDNILTMRADVAEEADIDKIVEFAVEQWGKIDVLVNNAGIFDDETFLTLKTETWDSVLSVNLRAPFILTQRVGRVMVEQGHGSIVNLASIDGHRVDGTYPAYNVSKAGLLHLTRQAAVELGPLGVRCNSVSPGWTRTPMVEEALTESQLQYMSNNFERVPIQRMVSSEEVSRAVIFLAGEEGSGITGTDIVVDGGAMANLWLLETLPE